MGVYLRFPGPSFLHNFTGKRNLVQDLKLGFMVNGFRVNGVWVHSLSAFLDIDDWYSDFINRALPEMGRWYMDLFIDAGFSPRKWMELVERG